MRYNIMFVDNNVGVLNELKSLFQDEPYHFFAFANPFEALNQIKKAEFAVVGVDQSLLEMTGIEFLKMVKQISPKTVRTIIAEREDLKAIVEAIKKGYVNQFILKPIDNQEIKQYVPMDIIHYEMRVANKGPQVNGLNF